MQSARHNKKADFKFATSTRHMSSAAVRAFSKHVAWRYMNSAAQHHHFPIARSNHFSYSARMNIDAAQHASIISLQKLATMLLQKSPDDVTLERRLDCRVNCMKLCNDFAQFDIVHRIIPWKNGPVYSGHVMQHCTRESEK